VALFLKISWIFVIGVGIWITTIAAIFEVTRMPAFRSFINKTFTQPNPITSSVAVIVMGIIIWYILKGIELGKKQTMD